MGGLEAIETLLVESYRGKGGRRRESEGQMMGSAGQTATATTGERDARWPVYRRGRARGVSIQAVTNLLKTSRRLRMTHGEVLATTALVLMLVKSIQFAFDSQALFYYDSGAFILNALRLAFIPYRSYAYGGLIRVFAVPFHSLRAIVAMQVIMGGVTAWLLAFALVRYLRVRAWIALLAAVVFAFDPVQIVHEHMVMTETAAMLAMAVFLVVALQYLGDGSLWWLAILSFLGVLLVSLRMVYLPVVLVAAVLLPAAACFRSFATKLRTPALAWALALSLLVSCGSTGLFQWGYRYATGFLAGREPAYDYSTGFSLLAAIAPIVEPGDSSDVRVAGAVAAQAASGLPLADPNIRWRQLWDADGLAAKLRTVFQGEAEPAAGRDADQAAQRLARAAILRNPVGFLGLGWYNYLGYWKGMFNLNRRLRGENGSLPPPAVNAYDARAVLSAFGADVSNQHTFNTPSRRYHLLAGYWCVFLLASPLLGGAALWRNVANPFGVALLFLWSCLLLAATCLGGVQTVYRYLHPLSFTGLAAAAVLADSLYGKDDGGKDDPPPKP